jgi:hypothetical protein
MDNNLIHAMLIEQNKTSMEQSKLLGEIKANLDTANEKLDCQLLVHQALDKRVITLENYRQRQIGSTRVWSLIGTAIGAALGFLATFFGFHK